MKCYALSAAVLALVGRAFAQIPGFDAISSPTDGQVIPAGTTFPISWEYPQSGAYDGTVTITLLSGASPELLFPGEVVAAGVDNKLGTYLWSVGADLGADPVYGIRITYDGDASGVTFQYSYPFHIQAASDNGSGSISSSSSTTDITTWTTTSTLVPDTTTASTDSTASTTTTSSDPWTISTGSTSSYQGAPTTLISSHGTESSSLLAPTGSITANGTATAGSSSKPTTLTNLTITTSPSATGAGSGPASTASAVVTAGAARMPVGAALFGGAVAAVFAL